jgi:hypothetical protein
MRPSCTPWSCALAALTLAACTANGSAARNGQAPTANPALDQACTPRFTLKMMDLGPRAAIFTEAMGADTEGLVQQIGRQVCRVLYRSADEVRNANHIELQIKDYKGVGGKWGDIGDIGVSLSTQYLDKIKKAGRDVRAEITGILHHEMTHMYQNDDKPEATFPGLPRMYEGIADAVRIRNGFPPARATPSDKSGRWQDKTYSSQAFFWLYVDQAHPGFLHKLNASMKGKDGVPWTPAEIEKITGQPADQLWASYQTATCCSASDQSCCK